MGTVIGAWTPFYGIGAIAAHWVSGILRDATGSYFTAFVINAFMAALGLVLFLFVNGPRPKSGERTFDEAKTIQAILKAVLHRINLLDTSSPPL